MCFALFAVTFSGRLHLVRVSLTVSLVLASAQQAVAGGGPENVFLVVNSRSGSSRAIANEYIQLRNIPPSNVFSISWSGNREFCNVSHFRDKILNPALEAIDERKLHRQIDYLIYSSDFPWRIYLQPDYPEEKFPKAFSPFASINGATYLWPYVLQENRAIVMPNVNWYAPKLGPNQVRCTQLVDAPSRAFRGRYFWREGGLRTDDPQQGQRYLLSTVLGVTTGRGNRLSEVINYLRRSAMVDAEQPRGTFYFMRNKDVRSQTRHNCYAATAKELQSLGARAVVKEGILPNGSRDVMGLMTGTKSYDINAADIQVIPGAICDNLTSYAGDLRAGAFQNPLTDFLRLGAAGASGAVREPTAQQAKFPLPSVHVHYRRGCSLAESFYQSVSGPYQLLIVGDPLCQPWATPPKVKVNVADNQQVSGVVDITPQVTPAPGKPVGQCELFLDGRLIARLPPGQTVPLDTAKLAEGPHELRVIASNADPIESQGRVIVPFTVRNRDEEFELKVTPSGKVPRLENLALDAHAGEGAAIRFLVHDREVGRLEGASGTVELSAGDVGPGPIRIRAEALAADGQVIALSNVVPVVVE